MDKRYHTSVIINDQKILPSDSFRIGENEYLLLDIFSDDKVYLHIVCSAGPHLGNEYVVPRQDFEQKNQEELARLLS